MKYKMKVKQLIEELGRCDPEAAVIFSEGRTDREGDFGPVEFISKRMVYNYKSSDVIDLDLCVEPLKTDYLKIYPPCIVLYQGLPNK